MAPEREDAGRRSYNRGLLARCPADTHDRYLDCACGMRWPVLHIRGAPPRHTAHCVFRVPIISNLRAVYPITCIAYAF